MKSASIYDGVLGLGGFIFQLPGIDELAAIHIVGDDGVLDKGKVHSYLVGSAGFGLHL